MFTTRAELGCLLLSQQGLLGDRPFGGTGGAITWIRRQGFLPLDMQSQGMAPGHDIVLLGRVSGYEAGGLDMALYDRNQLFEHCLHVRGVLPASDYRLIYDPERAAAEGAPGSIGAQVLGFLGDEGPATLRELQAHLRARGESNRRAIGQTIRGLHASGAILVWGREGSQERYALAEQVLPGCRDEALSPEDRLRALARRTLQVLAPVTRASWGQVLNAIGSLSGLGLAEIKREKRRLMAGMLAEGEAVQVEVGDPPAQYLIPASWVARLHERPRTGAPRLTFLSPLDPMIWDRQRARDLFGFDWRRQALPPSVERRQSPGRGLALLYGEALVGRIEPRMSWSQARLIVDGMHLRSPSLVEDQQFRAAFSAAVNELAALHEAREIQGIGPLVRRLLPS
jgi:uncharacterized protein YcaQ